MASGILTLAGRVNVLISRIKSVSAAVQEAKDAVGSLTNAGGGIQTGASEGEAKAKLAELAKAREALAGEIEAQTAEIERLKSSPANTAARQTLREMQEKAEAIDKQSEELKAYLEDLAKRQEEAAKSAQETGASLAGDTIPVPGGSAAPGLPGGIFGSFLGAVRTVQAAAQEERDKTEATVDRLRKTTADSVQELSAAARKQEKLLQQMKDAGFGDLTDMYLELADVLRDPRQVQAYGYAQDQMRIIEQMLRQFFAFIDFGYLQRRGTTDPALPSPSSVLPGAPTTATQTVGVPSTGSVSLGTMVTQGKL